VLKTRDLRLDGVIRVYDPISIPVSRDRSHSRFWTSIRLCYVCAYLNAQSLASSAIPLGPTHMGSCCTYELATFISYLASAPHAVGGRPPDSPNGRFRQTGPFRQGDTFFYTWCCLRRREPKRRVPLCKWHCVANSNKCRTSS